MIFVIFSWKRGGFHDFYINLFLTLFLAIAIEQILCFTSGLPVRGRSPFSTFFGLIDAGLARPVRSLNSPY